MDVMGDGWFLLGEFDIVVEGVWSFWDGVEEEDLGLEGVFGVVLKFRFLGFGGGVRW